MELMWLDVEIVSGEFCSPGFRRADFENMELSRL